MLKAYLSLSNSHSLPDQILVLDRARKKPNTAERNQAGLNSETYQNVTSSANFRNGD